MNRDRLVQSRLGSLVLAMVVVSALLCGVARAQAPAIQMTQEISPAQVNDLVRLLEDDQARRIFLQRLKALRQLQAEVWPDEPPAAEGLVAGAGLGFQAAVERALATTQTLVDWLRRLPQQARLLGISLTKPATYTMLMRSLEQLAFSLLPALVAFLVGRWLLRPLTRLRLPSRVWPLLQRLCQAVLQVAAEVLPTAGALILAEILLSVLGTAPRLHQSVVFLLTAALLYHLVTQSVRVLVTPKTRESRLVPITDETAQYLWLWSRRFLRYSIAYAVVMFGLSRLYPDPGAYQGLRGVLLCVFPALITIFVTQIARQGVRPEVVGTAETGEKVAQTTRQILYILWPFLTVLYIWSLTIFILVDASGGVGYLVWASVKTGLVILGLFMALRLLNQALAFASGISDQVRPRYSLLKEKANRYLKRLGDLCHGGLVLLAAGIVLNVWGIPTSWFLTAPAGRLVLTRLFIIVLVVGLTALALGLSKDMADWLLQTKIDPQGMVHEPSAKRKTLVPLAHAVVKVGLIFLAGLILLEQLGVNTGPVLAGVGILGLAVGFGAQSLVKDVINGLFILFEDSVAVGDVANLRGTGGLVEKITLRAVTLRDLSGNVHVIPNSSIDMVTNMTKEYSRYVLDVGVAYREDVDVVIDVLKEVDEVMRADPEFGTDMLEPIEILGLDRFADSAVVVRARLKTKPIKQWRIGREFNRRMKKHFDARGIEIPFPHRTLYWGMPKQGAQEAIHVAVEAESLASRND